MQLTLEAFWQFCEAGGCKVIRPSFAWFKVREPYLGSGRFFHNWGHIDRGWERLHIPEVQAYCHHHLETLAAWVVHDVVYDPFADDNEERSGQWGRDFYEALGMNRAALICQGYVSATDHRHLPVGHDGQAIADNDLYEFVVEREQFRLNTVAVRQEYVKVPDGQFATDQLEIFQSFLNRKAIFRTPYFKQFEDQARDNLTASIKELNDFLHHDGPATFNPPPLEAPDTP